MERTKRQQTDSVYNDNNNKKQKVQNECKRSHFESLANETIYEIFDYLNPYDIYQGFFYLNNRFRNLLINSNFPIQINISTMSKSNFELYHKNMIKPNKHRINILHLSNPFTVDTIFSPPRIICEFIQLETLILDNIDGRYLHNILKHLTVLPNLQSLVLTPTDYVEDPRILFTLIFHLPKLKSCKLTYQSKDDTKPKSIYLTEFKDSPIEYFVLNSRFTIDSLNDIFLSLPKLRYLSIDCLVGDPYTDIYENPIIPKCLKHVSIKLDYINFHQLEKFIQHFYFHHVEVLHISTRYDQAYLDAKRWEKLIVSSMPNLRIFDINHESGVQKNNSLSYHDLIEQFNSSFWIQRKWFFTHQHDWQQKLDEGIFYSTNPYRRKDYTFYWEFDPKLCLNTKENNLKAVKHVYVCSKQATQNCVNYFPNVNELTIEHYFKTFDDSISTTLNRILPLKQLNKLVIKSDSFSFEGIVKLLYFTPNLRILKLGMLSRDVKNSKLMQSDIFRHVSNTNKIQNLDIRESCSLESFQWIINLFPQLEYLKTGMNRKEMNEIIRFLFSKSNTKTRRLFFLCISHTPKVCLRELYLLIKSANLLKDYFIKYIKRDLYLWW